VIPRSTYRLQFHPGFTLEDARGIVPYLSDLGFSHIYASPLAEARSGSTHGYDVTDPTAIRSALGGKEALRALADDLHQHDMGLILDIVPNHMAASPENPWWADMLRHGRDSEFACFFDVDWSKHGGRVLLPVLGAPLDEALADGAIELIDSPEGNALRLYGEQTYPIAPGTLVADDLPATLERQHYRLSWWRLGHDELNWRRFFSISELAGLRIEDETVFKAVHELPLRLYREGVIDGLRIDHVDGLADPAAYLGKLRAQLEAAGRDDGPAWLIVEKILGPGETLPAGWPVDGTTGYDFMEEVALLLHSPQAEKPLARNWEAVSDRSADFEREERLARRQILHWEFTAQFDQCVDALVSLAARTPDTARHSRAAWARAVEALLIVFPVYRTYGTGSGSAPKDERVRKEAASRLIDVAAPGELPVGNAILDWLAGTGPASDHASEFVQRFQQLSAPIAAKAVEDTAFYRYGALISRNDVGFHPDRFSASPDTFHAWQVERGANWPNSMLATATHDHKRGEDVRARLFAISEAPSEWIAVSRRWMVAMPGSGEIDPGDLYMTLQAVIAAWPADPVSLTDFAERLRGYVVKTLREAKLRSSWTAPDEGYEKALADTVETLILGEQAAELREEIAHYLGKIAPDERVKSLAQLFLRLTCPGVSDTYQGSEIAERSLVDPDNRRPVDYDARRRLMREGSDEKLALLHELLKIREDYDDAFSGSYEPVDIGSDFLAFERRGAKSRLLMVTALRCVSDRPEARTKQTFPDIGDSLLASDLPCALFVL